MSRLLALDVNLLAYETSRRMLYGIALESGYQLTVLPEVHEELPRRIQAITQDRWDKILQGDGRYTNDQKEAILNAAKDEAVQAFNAQIGEEGCPFKLLTGSFEQLQAARRIARRLPRRIVRQPTGTIRGDPLILAEAMVFDVALLSTNNMNTIWHAATNEWVAKHLKRTTPIVYSPDETLNLISGPSGDLMYKWTMAYGLRPRDVGGDEMVNRTAYESALARIEGAGFGSTAETARWLYEDDPSFPRSLHKAQHREGVIPSAKLESQLVQPIYASAQAAGWEPPQPTA